MPEGIGACPCMENSISPRDLHDFCGYIFKDCLSPASP
jgi:hypothetical protein